MAAGNRRAPVILLPPSEGKAPEGSGPPWRPGTGVLPELDPARAEVLAALGAGVADAPTMRAIDRYTGVLYGQLDWGSLPAPARRLGARTVLIASGLWGMSGPNDRIPAYRLKMSANAGTPGSDGDVVAAAADRRARPPPGGPSRVGPAARRARRGVVSREVAVRRRVTVRFVDRNGRTVSHWNKLLKGALVRHLLTERPAGPEELAGWEHPSGYRVDEVASDLAGGPVRARPARGLTRGLRPG